MKAKFIFNLIYKYTSRETNLHIFKRQHFTQEGKCEYYMILSLLKLFILNKSFYTFYYIILLIGY